MVNLSAFNNPDDAINLGIGMVHQHFKLVPSFTIAQNVMLGMEPNKFGWLKQKEENERVEALREKIWTAGGPDCQS